ncbi:MAG: LysR family transcriptional regulator [Bdellovibrionales bacterium]
MDWDKLKAFYTVAQAKSFTRASDKLHLTQPSISRKISALEEELRTPLFHRHARGLILTEQGEILFETVSGIFATLSDAENKIKYSKNEEEGPLCITAPEMLTQSRLFPILPEFIKAHPNIQLKILETDQVLNLDKREADVAIRLFSPKQQDLIQQKIKDIDFKLVASKEYLDKYGRPKSLDDLKNHTLIAYPHDIPPPFPKPNWHLEHAQIDIDQHEKKVLSSSFFGTLSFIKSGCGIGTANLFEIEKDPNLEVILDDTFHHKIEAFFVYAQAQKKSKRILLIKDFLLKRLKK